MSAFSRVPILQRFHDRWQLDWNGPKPAGLARGVLCAYILFAVVHGIVRLVWTFGAPDFRADFSLLQFFGFGTGDFLISGFLGAVFLATGATRFIVGAVGLLFLKVVLNAALTISRIGLEFSMVLPSLNVSMISCLWILVLWRWVLPFRSDVRSFVS